MKALSQEEHMPPKNQITIYDVAKVTGVSITTVSRVLNASGKVNDVTRRRIMEAIDTLGFVPKAEARARALRAAGRIGVLSPFFYSTLLCAATARHICCPF